MGAEATPAIWDDPTVQWQTFDQVVLRSCWDYHLRSREFLEWVCALKRRDVPLQNPASIVLWNMDKRYLRELENRNVLIPGTYWVEEGQQAVLGNVISELGWRDLVVKPTVSATAYQTRKMSERDRSEVIDGPAMIQEFLPEIETSGEWSLMFLGGEFSHAVRKFPTAGDFRVQSEFGGTVQATVAKPEFIEQAATILDFTHHRTLYARIDGVERGVLMELELIEPVLFLGLGGAANSMARKILSSIS